MNSPKIIYTKEMYTGTTQFVHLHVHTVFSALDGCATPEQYAEQCFKRGYPAMSATEHGHMASVPDMHFAFQKYNIKYIAGCEIYYNDFEPKRHEIELTGVKVRSPKWRKDNPDLGSRIARNRHLTVLCKNEVGYHNLLKLTTQAYNTGLFGIGRTQYNRIWFDKLCEYKEGLIILSGCLNGPICHELRYRNLKDKEGNVIFSRDRKTAIDSAIKLTKKFKKEFGENFFIELQMPGIESIDQFGEPTIRDEDVFRWLISIADKFKIQIVLANDSHYLTRKDFELQKLMMAVAQNTTIDNPNLFHVNSSEQFMKTRPELWSRFKNNDYSKNIPDSVFETMCDNSLLIADMCDPFVIDTSPKIPEIKNADNTIRKIVAKELHKRGLDKINKKFLIDGREVTYVEQAKIELSRFIDKSFASYFLITRDLVKYGKQRGWPFSPRGCSIPDSLITMCDGTTKKIIDVEISDKVLDGLGNEQNVENKFVYDVSEELIELELEDGVKLIITIDHKLYIVRDGIVMLVRADELKNTDEIINSCSAQKNTQNENNSN